MNSKKALKQYREIYIDKNYNGDIAPSQEWLLDIIEKDLDRLEELEKENQELIKKTDCCMWHECNKISQENTKFKKAFDILKNKKVNIFHIWVFDDYKQYKEHYIFSEYHAKEDMMTEEEFNYLQEVFEYDN